MILGFSVYPRLYLISNSVAHTRVFLEGVSLPVSFRILSFQFLSGSYLYSYVLAEIDTVGLQTSHLLKPFFRQPDIHFQWITKWFFIRYPNLFKVETFLVINRWENLKVRLLPESVVSPSHLVPPIPRVRYFHDCRYYSQGEKK